MISRALKLTVPVLLLLLAVVMVQGQTQNREARVVKSLDSPTVQQPLISDYKGVRVGMTAEEAYAKIGRGTRRDEQEFYVFNENETALLVFDSANKVMGISVDYLNGVGAPDYRTVVGPDITVKPDGSMYKIVHYDHLGFWVSYNRTANTSMVMVSITIQRTLKYE